MATVTTTLADFLLARIAEDEEDARYAENYVPDDGPFVRWDSDRVLVECQAKRRVLEAWSILDAAARQADLRRDHEEARDARNTRLGVQIAMQALALPHADHPDYRDEWRP